MKTLFRNKKLMTGVITVMVGITILLAGIAFAWFFGANGNFDEKFDAGDMGAEADFDLAGKVLSRPVLPGDTERGIGEITVPNDVVMHNENPMLVRVAVGASEIIAKNGDSLPTDALTFAMDENGEPGEAWPLGFWMDVGTGAVPDYLNAKTYLWLKGGDGNVYVEMYGDDTLHYAFDIEAVGNKMDNRYLGAKITLGNGIYWIQSRNIEKALAETQVDAVHALVDCPDCAGLGYIPTQAQCVKCLGVGCVDCVAGFVTVNVNCVTCGQTGQVAGNVLPSTYFPGLAKFLADNPGAEMLDYFTFFGAFIDVRYPANNQPIGVSGPILFGSRIDLQKLYEAIPADCLTKAYLARVLAD